MTTQSDYSSESKPLGDATVGDDGRFMLRASGAELSRLRSDAAGNGGFANVEVVADDGAGMATTSSFSIDVGSPGKARLSAAAHPKTVSLDLKAPATPAVHAKADARRPHWHCPPPGTSSQKTVRRFRRWVQVGEANNAYRDSNATFDYGRQADTEATRGLSIGGHSFSVSGETHVGNSHGAAVGASTGGRGQVRVYTRFKYLEGRTRWCDYRTHKHYQRFGLAPHRWIKRVKRKHQHHALHRCPRKPKLSWPPRTNFARTHRRFKSYRHGYSIGPSFHGFGIRFHGSGTSGASSYARLHARFGRGHKHHYVCAKHGKSPFAARRVFSGARG